MTTNIDKNTAQSPIVVGVGPEGSDAALAFGVAAARRSHSPLHLIHGVQVSAGEEYAGKYGGVLEIANTTLKEAVARAGELASADVAVTGERVDDGWIVGGLVRHGNDGRMVVLEHRHRKALARLVSASVTNGVAARARVPVVSVPAGWSDDPNRHGVVTAAVQDPTEASLILRTAFEEATERGARLVVLHAWWLDSGYDAMVADRAYRDEWESRSKQELEPVLTEVGTDFPDVETSISVRHAPPIEAVLDATASSDLVVIGRRHHLLPLGTHLGPVARAALNHGECPVVVTPEVRAPTARTTDLRDFVTASI